MELLLLYKSNLQEKFPKSSSLRTISSPSRGKQDNNPGGFQESKLTVLDSGKITFYTEYYVLAYDLHHSSREDVLKLNRIVNISHMPIFLFDELHTNMIQLLLEDLLSETFKLLVERHR